MALKVIGAGLGRTGTASIKVALEQLGIGRCYHMGEVMQNPMPSSSRATLRDAVPVRPSPAPTTLSAMLPPCFET